MPNYRQKNKKKNNKKNNNNNNNKNNRNQNQNTNTANQNKSNQNQQSKQQKPLQQQQQGIAEEQAKLLHDQQVGNVSNAPTVECSNGTGERSNKVADECNDDTVSNENELVVTVSADDMGTKQSKVANEAAIRTETETEAGAEADCMSNEAKTQQVKLIIHRIVPEPEPEAKVIMHTIALVQEPEDEQQSEANYTNENKLQIEEILNEDDATLEPHNTVKPDDVKLKRAQKRAAIETHFLPQLLSPRYLDSILEENSELSETAERPKVQRSLSEGAKTQRVNAKFPRSQLDFSKTHKASVLPNTLPTLPGPICEEPLAMIVEAKLIEQMPNDPQESCSTLSFQHLEPQSQAAEVIFLNSSTSSSASDLCELAAEEEQQASTARETVDLDTDVQEIISKPGKLAINCITRKYIANLAANKHADDRESTPVNQAETTAVINLSSDEQCSEHSTTTIAEASTSELQATADCKSSNADDSSVLSINSFSDSSLIDASVEDSSSAEAFAQLEHTCREIMDNVREIVMQQNNGKSNGISSLVSLVDDVTYTPVINGKLKSPSPPPIPPPPCDFSVNVINELPSVSNKPQVSTLVRQESTDSHCSSSTNQSQCTAINLSSPLLSDSENNLGSIQKLRQLCTQKLASLPYGEEVLEELATVAQNIGETPAVQDQNVKTLEMSLGKEKPHEIVHKVLIEGDQLLSQSSAGKLRKNLTPSPPPPLPPPPVPAKSSETAAKAQQQTNARIIPITFEQNDASIRNGNTKEQKTTFTPLNAEQQNKTMYANEIAAQTTSSFENNSRQAAPYKFATGKEILADHFEQQVSKTETSNATSASEMQSVESEIGRMFPTLGANNIFDAKQKRFSNIESGANKTFATAAPKRYSNIETSSYEQGKRIENGEVIYDYEDRRQEARQAGDEVDAAKIHDINIAKNLMTDNMRSTAKLSEQLQSVKSNVEKVHEQDKLFKDFDDLSQQLHHELETGRKEREEREKSASLFDLNHSHMKTHLDELKQKRHEHMKELEREIDRSMKSRQLRRIISHEPTTHKTYEIPVQVEQPQVNGKEQHETHNIPITLEREHDFQHDSNSPFRRAESMYNLMSDPVSRPRTSSSNYESQQQFLSDDWSQYASDLGSSENITRPFAKEMQICYQRQRQPSAPRTIRAPRLTVSTHDLSPAANYDHYNAFNVPRSPRNTSSTSCYSLLERDPNPTYIGTTSRRGVSPAPVQPTPKPAAPNRRASLPREIHEQQLKYINSKEEELRTEFERLQNERRRLLEELEREQEEVTPQIPPRARDKDIYRGATRLPTLSEDEVFRQQMAEEWMSKVAEREERRLQKIIKVSKMHEQQAEQKYAEEEYLPQSPFKTDLSQEFLSRVKERRHKLHMPADSDWESGAESHPNAKSQQAENAEPHIKVISGKSVKDVHELPQHLKEFARYSEALENGGQRHVYEEQEKRQESTPYGTSSAAKKTTMLTTMKIPRQPPHILNPRQDTTTLDSESESDDDFRVPDTTSSLHDTHLFPKLPEVFDQMFASSPFRERIYEEYERFWHNFNHQNTFYDTL